MSRRNPSADPGARVTLYALAALLFALAPTGVLAEKADREKPIQIDADRQYADQKKEETIFEGHVVITQGTLRLDADRVVIRQDKDKNNYVTATGNPATFRQKLDRPDEYIDGHAQRIEYNDKESLAQFFDRAKVRRNQDEINSNYIRYNATTEVFEAYDPGQKQGGPESGRGRVRAIIQPKQKDASGKASTLPATSNAPLTLKPADTVNPARQ
jgi:lipopolysaccharide export system protein LptA